MYTLLSILTIIFLSSCSAHRTSLNTGVSASDIKSCATKACLLAYGMERIEVKESNDGKITELYKGTVTKSGFNYARAGEHTLLDVTTPRLPIVNGIPINGSSNSVNIIVEAIYLNKDAKSIEKLRLYNSYGRRIK